MFFWVNGHALYLADTSLPRSAELFSLGSPGTLAGAVVAAFWVFQDVDVAQALLMAPLLSHSVNTGQSPPACSCQRLSLESVHVAP